jgi:nitrite reductase/ring-hydroxylating ferredoxin subunit
MPTLDEQMIPCLDLSRPWLSARPVAWPVLPSVDLRHEAALSIQAFGLPILLVRGRDGYLSVHIDRCPHRHVSFSVGGTPPKVEGSNFNCPYHFQSFDQSGRCVSSLHGESGTAEHLVCLPAFERDGFIFIVVSRQLFSANRKAAYIENSILQAQQDLRMPGEFARELNNVNTFDCLPLFNYRYPVGSWNIVITSGIDHTHGFHVHGIAKSIHRVRRWLGQETLSGIHMLCNDEERSVLVTYSQYKESLRAYWKVGGVPNLWLNKLDPSLYIAVLFVPESATVTSMRGCIYVSNHWKTFLENPAMLSSLKELSLMNSEEDRPFIESQMATLANGQIPVGNASVNDAPVYRFYRYLELITGTPINFHDKPNALDLMNQWEVL